MGMYEVKLNNRSFKYRYHGMVLIDKKNNGYFEIMLFGTETRNYPFHKTFTKVGIKFNHFILSKISPKTFKYNVACQRETVNAVIDHKLQTKEEITSITEKEICDFGYHSIKNEKNETIIVMIGGRDSYYRSSSSVILFNCATRKLFVKANVCNAF